MPISVSAESKKDPIEVGGDRFSGTVNFNVDPPSDPLPLHVVFCIDKSSSMSGKDIKVAKEGLNKATKKLDKTDSFGVVAFSRSAEEVVPPTQGDKAESYSEKISNLSAGGGTKIMNGLERSKQMLDEISNSTSLTQNISDTLLGGSNTGSAIKWIVLITDGGSSINEQKLKNNFDNAGITIQAAGIRNYRQRVIQSVAEQTQGEWADVGRPRNLEQFFKQKLSEARGVAATDPTLHISPTHFVDVKSVYYTHGDQQSTVDPDWSGTECIIGMSDMMATKEPTVQLDLFADGEASLERQKLLDVTLETEGQTVSDDMTVEVAAGVVVEENSDEESGSLDGVAIGDVMETAIEEGASRAESKIETWEKEEEVTEETVNQMESVIEDMKNTSDEKEAKDEISRVLGQWGADENNE
jgi:hypothetical protein